MSHKLHQGVAEIHLLLDKLAASRQFGGQSSEWLLPLHSSISSADQKKAFLRPPDNMRKVKLLVFGSRSVSVFVLGA